MTDRHYLELLSKEYPTQDAASAELINLSAICRLPKGTEYFFSDIHGESEAFSYLLGTASGVIGAKIEALFHNSVPQYEREELSSLICSPEGILMRHELDNEWCRVVIFRLIQICKTIVSKYTRSKVRKKMPSHFSYILDELLHADTEENKEDYFNAIITTIIDTGVADRFILALCGLIRQSSIDKLHILGDIFDRGPHADLVMQELMTYSDVDIQWGNHDIHWMAAAMGNAACVANVVRLAVSYNNFDLLEDSYGINLRPLFHFAAETYKDDACERFRVHLLDQNQFDPISEELAAKMHKAIAIIGLKLEAQMVSRHPEYEMGERALLNRVDFAGKTVEIDGKTYQMLDSSFPTVDPADPARLSPEEEELIGLLTHSFVSSGLLQWHVRFLFNNGGMYKVANGNLLYHGCIPLDEDGGFKTVMLDGAPVAGKDYLDAIDAKLRRAYYDSPDGCAQRADAGDFMWYLWCGPNSPLYGKDKMTTFERYFVAEPETHSETYNPYYQHSSRRETCEAILREFGLDAASGHIINGHVPVRVVKGEKPIKADGKLFVIDGGISKAYQTRTGMGGYTLISNSHSLSLAQHQPYEQVRQECFRQPPKVEVVERYPRRQMVADTDNGRELIASIDELKDLLTAYRSGQLREAPKKTDK